MLHGILAKSSSVQSICLEVKEKLKDRERQLKNLAKTASKVHHQKKKRSEAPQIIPAQRRHIPPAQQDQLLNQVIQVASTIKVGGNQLNSRSTQPIRKADRTSICLSGKVDPQTDHIKVKMEELPQTQGEKKQRLNQLEQNEFEYSQQTKRLLRSVDDLPIDDFTIAPHRGLLKERSSEDRESENDGGIDSIPTVEKIRDDLEQNGLIPSSVTPCRQQKHLTCS